MMEPLIVSAIISANAGIISTLITVFKRTNGTSLLAQKLNCIDNKLRKLEDKVNGYIDSTTN